MKKCLAVVTILFIIPLAVFGLMGDDLDRTKVSMDEAAAALLPENGVVITSCEADLNGDGRRDFLVAFEYLDDERELIVLTDVGNGAYAVAARNRKAILRADEGGIYGDPFVRIWADNGKFGVDHFGGSNWKWSNNSEFEYSVSDGTWYLTRFQTDEYDLDNNDTNRIYTAKDFGQATLDEFDMSKVTAGDLGSAGSEASTPEGLQSENGGGE